MAAELTAVRLLAPHFGDSAYVWTNVIGVILAAMAIGAVVGGRLSARDNAAAWPFRLLLAAGALLLVAPLLTSWLGTALLPDDLPLDAAMPALIRGSLVATAVVFAPPLLLLAAVSPLLIVLLAQAGRGVGKAAGDVAAAGTIGSLVGTFVATHWLVPGLGCRLALAVSAGVLLLAAALAAPRKQRALAGLALFCGIGLPALQAGPLAPGPLRQTKASVELLAERETPYQFLQVHRSKLDGEPARTTLVINEGLDSFHSLQIEGSAFTGAYYDWHAVAPFFAADGAVDQDLRVLSVGDAAGTLRQVYAAVHPGVAVDAVDIDAETMAIGDEFFAANKAQGERYAIDGRVFLNCSKQRWHVIHVDAYAHQVYVPAHLASREFFQAAHERLHEGGVLACNVGALNLQDAVLQAVAATVASVFEDVRVLLVPASRNAVLLARRGKQLDPSQLNPQTLARPQLTRGDRAIWNQVATAAVSTSNWHRLAAPQPVLHDDRPELDELLFRSYVEQTDPRRVIACTGTRSVIDAELTAGEALRAGRYREALEAVTGSSQATALLRQTAGDARWFLRELHSARLEYVAALELAPDTNLRGVLDARLASVSEQVRPIDDAEAAATRNGWLSVLVCAAGLLSIVLLRRSA